MKVFVTVVRGLMHKRTERIQLEANELLTDDLLQAVSRRLILEEEAFRLVKTQDKHNLRVVRGWPLSLYEITTGSALSLTIERPLRLELQPSVPISPNPPLQSVQQDPEEQLEDVQSVTARCRSDSQSSMSIPSLYTASKSSMRSFMDNQLERLLGEATNGTLERFSAVMRERPVDSQLLQNIDYYEQSVQHLLNQLGEGGWSVLHCATFNGKLDIVEYLLIKGAEPNLQTVEGWTSLMLAIKAQNMKIVKVLLEHPNIKVNQTSPQGSALYIAVEADLVEFAELLLKYKASQRIAGRDGVLPTELCRSERMERLFTQHIQLANMEPTVMRGYVFKQSAFYTNQLRYLVCDPYAGTLARYESESYYPSKPIETIPLKEILEVRVIPKEDLQWLADKNLFYFEVFHTGRLIYCTESRQVTECWVECIFKMVAMSLLSKEKVRKVTGSKKVIKTTLREILSDSSWKGESVLEKSRGQSVFGSLLQRNSESMEKSSTVESPPTRKLKVFEHDRMDSLDIGSRTRERTGTSPIFEKSEDKLESTCSTETRVESRLVAPTQTDPSHKQKSCIIVRELRQTLPLPAATLQPFTKKWKSHDNAEMEEYKPAQPVSVREAVKYSSFEIMKQLGKGAFGRVFLAKHKPTNRIFALKALSKRNLMLQRQMRYAISEANILRQTDHPFVVKLWYSFQTQHNLYMCLDYCSCGDLSEYLAHKQKLSELEAKWIIAQLLLALEYLHSKNILYRDLKPENILLHEDGYIRLADFGLSKADNVGLTYSFCGSPAYLSPEMISQRGVGKEVDVYGMGCVLHEMLLGHPPHFANDIDQLYKNIRQGKLKLPATLSEEVRDLLKNLLQRQPTRRMSIAQAKQHPFFRDVNFLELLQGRSGRSNYQNISQLEPQQAENSDSETNSDCESFSDTDYEPQPAPRINRVTKFSFEREAQAPIEP